MSRTRVLYTINNLSTAGMKYVLADLVAGVDRTLFEPLVAVGCKTNSALEREIERTCPVLAIPTKTPRRPRRHFISRLRETASRLRHVADVAHSFDYASDWTEGLAMRMAGVPWIAEKTNLSWDDRRWWLRSCLAKRIVCLSTAQQRVMRGWRSKTVLVPTGVDLERFASAPPIRRSALNADAHDVLLVCVAHLVPVKGHEELILATAAVARDLPRLKLVLVGEGSAPHTERLQRLAVHAGVGDRVVFLGARRDVASVLKACDGKVLATRDEGRREAFGAALVEAMAAGLPVIATRSGGPEDIVVHGETGWLIDANGWAPLADAIREFYVDAGRRSVYGNNGLKRARTLYGKDLMTRRYEDIYTSVLGLDRASASGARG
jgi:glycosyltransferase involved in cell wall biosynthesis